MDDTQQSRNSDAGATRKRRSSILKVQRSTRAPFSELELNVATPTDCGKSRRVSFSRRTGVAEFVTNEATTTWKNFYEEHNKTLELSVNDGEGKPPPAPHIRKTLFDQQFQEVETVDLVSMLHDDRRRNVETSLHGNFVDQLECTSDTLLAAPQHKFELSNLTDHQSKLYSDDRTVSGMGELSGRINVNFSLVQPIGMTTKDDLDEIERHIQRNAQNACPGPRRSPLDVSEYIEVDILDTTRAQIAHDESDMSITDIVYSPKVQDVTESMCVTNEKKRQDSDWVTDKENIAVNPYIMPKESNNFAINEDPDKVLVFDGKRLTIQSDKQPSSSKKCVNSVPAISRKTIVLNTDDDLPNFVNDHHSMYHLKTMSFEEDLSITKPLPTNLKMTQKRKTIVFENDEGNVSMTQALPGNIIPEKEINVTNFFDDSADISVTQAIPGVIFKTQSLQERRRPIMFDEDEISVTKAVPNPILKTQSLQESRKCISFIADDASNISYTQAVPYAILKTESSQEKRITIAFDEDAISDISVTQAVPNAILKTESSLKRREFDEDDASNISVTQAVPNAFLKTQFSQEKSKIIDFDVNDVSNISVTEAVPNAILKTEPSLERRRTIAFDGSASNISVTQAVPNAILKTEPSLERRRTIAFDGSASNISVTQAVPNAILKTEPSLERRRTIAFDGSASNISVTQAVPNAILKTEPSLERRRTIAFDGSASNISVTQAVPNAILKTEPSLERRRTIAFDSGASNISVTQAVPNAILKTEPSLERRRTIAFDGSASNISVTQAVPNAILKTEPSLERRRTIAFDGSASNISVTQSVPNAILKTQFSQEKRKTIDFDVTNPSNVPQPIPCPIDEGNASNISVTQAVRNTALETRFLQEKNKSIAFCKDDKTNISVTKDYTTLILKTEASNNFNVNDGPSTAVAKSLPNAFINMEPSQDSRRATFSDEAGAADISITQAVPNFIFETQSFTGQKTIYSGKDEPTDINSTKIALDSFLKTQSLQETRKSIIYRDSNVLDISFTQAVPDSILKYEEKKNFIVYDGDDATNVLITQGIPSVILNTESLSVQSKNSTGKEYITDPSNIILKTVSQEERKTTEVNRAADIPVTPTVPNGSSNIQIPQGNIKSTFSDKDDVANITDGNGILQPANEVNSVLMPVTQFVSRVSINKKSSQEHINFIEDEGDIAMAQDISDNIRLCTSQKVNTQEGTVVFDKGDVLPTVRNTGRVHIDNEDATGSAIPVRLSNIDTIQKTVISYCNSKFSAKPETSEFGISSAIMSVPQVVPSYNKEVKSDLSTVNNNTKSTKLDILDNLLLPEDEVFVGESDLTVSNTKTTVTSDNKSVNTAPMERKSLLLDDGRNMIISYVLENIDYSVSKEKCETNVKESLSDYKQRENLLDLDVSLNIEQNELKYDNSKIELSVQLPESPQLLLHPHKFRTISKSDEEIPENLEHNSDEHNSDPRKNTMSILLDMSDDNKSSAKRDSLKRNRIVSELGKTLAFDEKSPSLSAVNPIPMEYSYLKYLSEKSQQDNIPASVVQRQDLIVNEVITVNSAEHLKINEPFNLISEVKSAKTDKIPNVPNNHKTKHQTALNYVLLQPNEPYIIVTDSSNTTKSDNNPPSLPDADTLSLSKAQIKEDTLKSNIVKFTDNLYNSSTNPCTSLPEERTKCQKTKSQVFDELLDMNIDKDKRKSLTLLELVSGVDDKSILAIPSTVTSEKSIGAPSLASYYSIVNKHSAYSEDEAQDHKLKTCLKSPLGSPNRKTVRLADNCDQSSENFSLWDKCLSTANGMTVETNNKDEEAAEENANATEMMTPDVVSDTSIEIDEPEVDQVKEEQLNLKDANSTSELLKMLVNFTEDDDTNAKSLQQDNPTEMKSSSESVALSDETVISNETAEQSVLDEVQSGDVSVASDESRTDAISDPVSTGMIKSGDGSYRSETSLENGITNKPSVRISDEVFQYEDLRDVSSSEEDKDILPMELGLDDDLSPLKKTAFGETSYMTDIDKKSKVIPSYMKDVSENMKRLMLDLIKPISEVMPFDSSGVERDNRDVANQIDSNDSITSTCSTQVQADLNVTSQIDVGENETLSACSQVYQLTSESNMASKSSVVPSESIPFVNEEPRTHNVIATDQVIEFDEENPLNNILLPINYSNVHKYDPNDNDTGKRANEGDTMTTMPVQCQQTTMWGSQQYHVARATDLQAGDTNLITETMYDPFSAADKPFKEKSIRAEICEIKDVDVNTVIAMKNNRELLEVSSSLTLVEKSSHSSNVVRITSSDSTVQEERPLYEIDCKVVPGKLNSEENDTPSDKDDARDRDVASERDNSQNSAEKRELKSRNGSTGESPLSKKIKTSKLSRPKGKGTTCSTSPECSKRNENSRSFNTKTSDSLNPVRAMSPSKNLRSPRRSPTRKKQCLSGPAARKTDSIYIVEATPDIEVLSVGNEVKSKAEKSISESCVKRRSVPNWQSELADDASSKYLVNEISSVNVVSEIDKLSFMGSADCSWDEEFVLDKWSFRLMHRRVKLCVRFHHRQQNSMRRTVRADTPVRDLTIELCQPGKYPVARMCIRFAVECMRTVLRGGCARAGDVPALLRRCAGVARVAALWSRAMHEAKLQLAYTIDDHSTLTLKVANIPLRSVWRVTMHLQLERVAGECGYPVAEGVAVCSLVSHTDITEEEVRRELCDVPRDWGHVPRTLWKIFRYLKNKTSGGSLLTL